MGGGVGTGVGGDGILQHCWVWFCHGCSRLVGGAGVALEVRVDDEGGADGLRGVS